MSLIVSLTVRIACLIRVLDLIIRVYFLTIKINLLFFQTECDAQPSTSIGHIVRISSKDKDDDDVDNALDIKLPEIVRF